MEEKKNVLLIEVEEANLAVVDDGLFLNLSDDPDEALRRYEALAEVMLAQLVGLKDCHVRFIVRPADGVDAVRFWLLPKLRGEVTVLTGKNQVYQFLPEQHAPSFTIDFAVDEGDLSAFDKVARLNFFCLECGARWLNMAFLQCSESKSVRVNQCLSVRNNGDAETEDEVIDFPEMALIQSDEAWQDMMNSPLGGKLVKLYEKT